MQDSRSLTDKEWEILEPLLLQLLPTKKRTRPPNRTNRQILDGIFYQLKNDCNWEDLPCIPTPLLDRILGFLALAD
ncbi:MAG: transposase [Cyanobacteriota bacterium]